MIDKHKKCAPCQIKQDDDNEMIYHIIHFQFQPNLHEDKLTKRNWHILLFHIMASKK